ncbi:MAG: aquaporin, partial [Saprospiraceae bacterium]|nr:aquaporin [Saprospiraceae bacterium]
MNVFLAELLGTALLILLGNGVVAGVVLRGTKSENSGWIVITIGWALAVTFAVYAVGGISGAHLNPAVSLSLAVTGQWSEQFTPVSLPIYLLGQMLGAMLGAALVF